MSKSATKLAVALGLGQDITTHNARTEGGALYLHDHKIAEKVDQYTVVIFPHVSHSTTTLRHLNAILMWLSPEGWEPGLYLKEGELMLAIPERPHSPNENHAPAQAVFHLDIFDWVISRSKLADSQGNPVTIGHPVRDNSGNPYRISGWRRPHKPGSTGRVEVMDPTTGETREYFPGVFNLSWELQPEAWR